MNVFRAQVAYPGHRSRIQALSILLEGGQLVEAGTVALNLRLQETIDPEKCLHEIGEA